MENGMNVLSLFDGMSCGRIALERAGIEVENYFSSEIDKHALKVADVNWPCDTANRLGDVTKIDASKLPKIDLLMGGSPCQSFSFAGTRNGMITTCEIEILNLETYLELKENGFSFSGQSYLFWEYVKLLQETKPKYFLLENVKMDKKWEGVISKTLGISPVKINSSLVSAQNRERLYWTNIPIKTMPEDKLLTLKDVVDFGTGKKLTEVTSKRPRTIRNYRGLHQKAFCLLATMYKLSQSNGMTVIDDNGLRCITAAEAEKLQTVPLGYTAHTSDTQRYKMLGNGWTVDVIAHILKGIQNPNV